MAFLGRNNLTFPGFSNVDQVPILTSHKVTGVLWWGVYPYVIASTLPHVSAHILTHQGPGEDEGPTPEFRVVLHRSN